MTPGAGTAQSVGRVWRRQMWRVGSFCGFVLAGSRHCVGHPGVTSGAPTFAGRSNVVLCRPFCGVARRGAIHDARCRNGTIGRPRLASADVACWVVLRFCIGRFAALRWSSGRHKWRPHVCGAVECCLASAGSRHCVGHPGVTSGAPTFAGRLNVVWRRLVRGVARRGAIHDARCRNGTIRRPCGFFEPSGKGGLHSGGCPKILCFQIVVPHVCITFAA